MRNTFCLKLSSTLTLLVCASYWLKFQSHANEKRVTLTLMPAEKFSEAELQRSNIPFTR